MCIPCAQQNNLQFSKIVLDIWLRYGTIVAMSDKQYTRVGLADNAEHPDLLANLKGIAEDKGYPRYKFATYIMRLLSYAMRRNLAEKVQPFRK